MAFDQAVSPPPQSCHKVASLGLIEKHSKKNEEFLQGGFAKTLLVRPIWSLHCTKADSLLIDNFGKGVPHFYTGQAIKDWDSPRVSPPRSALSNCR